MGQPTRQDQSWSNPQSKWRQSVRSSYFIVVAIGLCFSGISLATAWYGWHSVSTIPFVPGMDQPKLDWADLIMIGFFTALALILPIIALWFAEAQRRLARRVVNTDGRICPWCRDEIQTHEDSSATLVCPCCSKTLAHEDVQQYWVNYWLHLRGATEWKKKQQHPKARVLRRVMSYFRPPTQEDPRVRVGWIGSLIAICAAYFTLYLVTENPIRGILFGTLLSLFFISTWGIIYWQARRPAVTGRFCAACKYQLPPETTPSGNCPECGADWSKCGGYVSGRLTEKRARFVSFLPALFAIPIMVVFFMFTEYGPLGSWTVTTNMLIDQVTIHDRYGVRGWDVLLERDMTDEQQTRLAQGLLKRREVVETLERQANAWFIREIELEALSREFAESYQSGILKLIPEIPDDIHVGDHVDISLINVVQFQNIPPFDRNMAIVFGGFLSGDGGATPVGRSGRIERASSFGSQRVMYGMWDSPYLKDHGPVATLIADRPGAMTVRGRYWILWLPQILVNEAVEWNDDGTPILPDGVQWVIEQEISTTIDVQPSDA